MPRVTSRSWPSWDHRQVAERLAPVPAPAARGASSSRLPSLGGRCPSTLTANSTMSSATGSRHRPATSSVAMESDSERFLRSHRPSGSCPSKTLRQIWNQCPYPEMPLSRPSGINRLVRRFLERHDPLRRRDELPTFVHLDQEDDHAWRVRQVARQRYRPALLIIVDRYADSGKT